MHVLSGVVGMHTYPEARGLHVWTAWGSNDIHSYPRAEKLRFQAGMGVEWHERIVIILTCLEFTWRSWCPRPKFFGYRTFKISSQKDPFPQTFPLGSNISLVSVASFELFFLVRYHLSGSFEDFISLNQILAESWVSVLMVTGCGWKWIWILKSYPGQKLEVFYWVAPIISWVEDYLFLLKILKCCSILEIWGLILKSIATMSSQWKKSKGVLLIFFHYALCILSLITLYSKLIPWPQSHL